MLKERSFVNERRLNMHLMAYWQELRGSRDYVSPKEFDPAPLGDIWSDCFMVNAVERRNEMIFQHLGRQIALASKVPPDLWSASEVPEKTLLTTVLDSVPEVLTGQQPIVSGGEFKDFLGRRCLFRGILLPLGEDRQSLQCLVGGARCRAIEGES